MAEGIWNMRRLCGAAAVLAVAGCGLSGADGNGQRVNEVRALQGFSAVETAASLDVQITRGDEFHVEVSVDSNLLRAVRTDLVGDVLLVDVSGPIGDTVAGPHVIVTMPTLRRAAVSGSGSLSASGFQQVDPVTLVIDGSGQLSFSGDVPRADVLASGSGDTRLQGTAAALAVVADGLGTVDARGLDAMTADLSIDGSGDLAANVSGSARVSVSGSGSVDLYGNAVLERLTVSGSGSVTRH